MLFNEEIKVDEQQIKRLEDYKVKIEKSSQRRVWLEHDSNQWPVLYCPNQTIQPLAGGIYYSHSFEEKGEEKKPPKPMDV